MKNIYAPSFYSVLCLEPFAPVDQIRAAWRELIKKYHPDVNPDSIDTATTKSTEINAAYAVLSDSIQKAIYDDNLSSYIKNEEAKKRKREETKSQSGNYSTFYQSQNAEEFYSELAKFIVLLIVLLITLNEEKRIE